MADVISLAYQTKQIVDTCKFIYGDKREEIKAIYKAKLEKHQKENNTASLLSSAIAMSEWQDEKLVIVLIASAV